MHGLKAGAIATIAGVLSLTGISSTVSCSLGPACSDLSSYRLFARHEISIPLEKNEEYFVLVDEFLKKHGLRTDKSIQPTATGPQSDSSPRFQLYNIVGCTGDAALWSTNPWPSTHRVSLSFKGKRASVQDLDAAFIKELSAYSWVSISEPKW